MKAEKTLYVVVPCYREEAVLPETARRLKEKLTALMSAAPRRRFGISGGMQSGDYTVFDLNETYSIDPDAFASMGRATPFAGMQVYGRCKMTVSGGKIVWSENLTEK